MKKTIFVLIIFCFHLNYKNLFAYPSVVDVHSKPENWAESFIDKFLSEKTIDRQRRYFDHPELVHPDGLAQRSDYRGFASEKLSAWSRRHGQEAIMVYMVVAIYGRDADLVQTEPYVVVRENGVTKIHVESDAEFKNWFAGKMDKPIVIKADITFLSSSETYDNKDKYEKNGFLLVTDLTDLNNRRCPVFLKSKNPNYKSMKNYITRARAHKKEHLCEVTIEVGPKELMLDGNYGVELLKIIHPGWLE